MAIDPVPASAASSPARSHVSGEAPDALAALAAGESVDAMVLARLETGAVRLSLLGTLLDIMTDTPLSVGEKATLTMVQPGTVPVLALARAGQLPALPSTDEAGRGVGTPTDGPAMPAGGAPSPASPQSSGRPAAAPA